MTDTEEAARRPRLPATERREAVLHAACCAFGEGSYRGTTTAEIARAAGVTEPVLYRHFSSKKDLYLACLDESWARMRALWERAVEDEPDPASWVRAIAAAYRESGEIRATMSSLWVQALSEAAEDEEIRHYMLRHMRDVHDVVADVHREAQRAGGIDPDRDPSAEAWIFIAIGLLRAVNDTLGGLVEDEFPAIGQSRYAWLTGRA